MHSLKPASLLEMHFLSSHISPGFRWKQGNKQNINLTEKMNPRVRFKSQEKCALYGIGDHDSHLRQDVEVEKEPQLEHTHHVNPPLLSVHIWRSNVNAFCKRHNAKKLHWKRKKSWQCASGSGHRHPCGNGSAAPKSHRCAKAGGSSLPLPWVKISFETKLIHMALHWTWDLGYALNLFFYGFRTDSLWDTVKTLGNHREVFF